MWKDIKGYECYYQVSDSGEVRSLDRVITQRNGRKLSYKGHIMKQALAIGKGRKDGYYIVNLRNGTKAHTIAVHLLVARAFIQNPEGLPTVNHKDGVKTNNKVSNLEWMSYGDNNVHALKYGLRNPRKGVRVAQFDANGNFVAIYDTIREAWRSTGLNCCSISHCINKIQEHTHDGSTFQKFIVV